jgi:uncharacterized protein (TIGR00369 family)
VKREEVQLMSAHLQVANPAYERMVRESFEKQGLMRTLAARLVTVEPGYCVIEIPYAPGVSQQQGFFHAGVIGAIADNAAGYAAYALMPAGAEILTVEYKLNLIRPACPPLLRAEGRVLRAGKTLTVCRADVSHTGPNGLETCALMQSTMMRVEPSPTRGSAT